MPLSDRTRDLLDLGAATLGESGAQPMRARVRPVWSGARLAAPALLREALDTVLPADLDRWMAEAQRHGS